MGFKSKSAPILAQQTSGLPQKVPSIFAQQNAAHALRVARGDLEARNVVWRFSFRLLPPNFGVGKSRVLVLPKSDILSNLYCGEEPFSFFLRRTTPPRKKALPKPFRRTAGLGKALFFPSNGRFHRRENPPELFAIHSSFLHYSLLYLFAISHTAATSFSTSAAVLKAPRLHRTAPSSKVPSWAWAEGAQ